MIDLNTWNRILVSTKNRRHKGTACLISMQDIRDMTRGQAVSHLLGHGFTPSFPTDNEYNAKWLFKLLGYDSVDCLDIDYSEHANIQHNLNTDVPAELQNKYDLIFESKVAFICCDPCSVLVNMGRMVAEGGLLILDSGSCTAIDVPYYNIQPSTISRLFVGNGFKTAYQCINVGAHIIEFNPTLRGLSLPNVNHFFVAEKQKHVFSYDLPIGTGRPDPNSDSFVKSVFSGLEGKKVAIWGTGGYYKKHFREYVASNKDKHDFVGLFDSDKAKHGTQLDGMTVFSPEKLKELDIDVIAIASIFTHPVFDVICDYALKFNKPQLIHATWEANKGAMQDNTARDFMKHWR